MKGVVFDISGEFAHFRKFYTNSSSLSHSVPPRTTIMGLIAGMLGKERDTYYEELSSKNLKIALKKNGGTRPLTQTLNYLKAGSVGDLRCPKAHTQIPVEILRGQDGRVSYRIVAVAEDGVVEELEQRIAEKRFVFPPTLGTSFFQADVDFVTVAEAVERVADGPVVIDSVIPVDFVESLSLADNRVIREKMARDFTKERGVLKARPYLVEEKGQPLVVTLKEGKTYWDVAGQYVVFM